MSMPSAIATRMPAAGGNFLFIASPVLVKQWLGFSADLPTFLRIATGQETSKAVRREFTVAARPLPDFDTPPRYACRLGGDRGWLHPSGFPVGSRSPRDGGARAAVDARSGHALSRAARSGLQRAGALRH